ncbi:hypothetical protein [Aeromicrobium sp.]|uniref:hypothetical protein n=1 Tax=Aeromicrobium sp. TaxID=1871063 RepID=UPI0028AEC52A|nr:hypothetical protein [Aeromicrobium sp.]
MRRFLCSALILLTVAAGCGRDPEKEEPDTPVEVTRLTKLAQAPEVDLDPTDAPAPPRGFSRTDVIVLATRLVEAVERASTADADAAATARDAVDHTFAGLDMRSRVDMTKALESASRHYRRMPVAWTVADRWDPGHRPARPARVIKAAWRVEVENAHLGVTLQTVHASIDPHGHAMFVRRTWGLWNAEPQRAPASQTYLDFAAGVTGIDRCHVVATGRFRPEQSTARLARQARYLRDDLTAKGVTQSSDTDFRRGCD